MLLKDKFILKKTSEEEDIVLFISLVPKVL